MTHLILHKVRGKPAFDVAEPCCPGPRPCQPNCGCWDGERCSAEDEWIIPTSGHTAYPYRTWPLANLRVNDVALEWPLELIPDDWPDHYQAKSEPTLSLDLAFLMRDLMAPARKFLRRF